MGKLVFTKDELMADHDYAREHIEAGFKLHGGFNEAGDYISPRTKHRWEAVENWAEALKARGHDLIEVTGDLLHRDTYPNHAQAAFLIQNGDGQTLWNQLTTTGITEAKGRALVDLVPPRFDTIIQEDISETAVGHLHKGLLIAHGMDEGGNPDKGEGGHDDMWFAVRDALLGKDAYPLVEPLEIGRPEQGRQMPQVPEFNEAIIKLLMNVLMVEVRAEAFFNYCVDIMRDPRLFTDRRAAAEHAAVIVDRIREDERIHVAYLQLVVSELRTLHFKQEDGSTVLGADFIDPIWAQMVEWHGETALDLGRERSRETIAARFAQKPDGADLLSQFDALEEQRTAA